jgi:hypothetical protein
LEENLKKTFENLEKNSSKSAWQVNGNVLQLRRKVERR